MLQAICGQMITIVPDDASFHNPLNQTEDTSQDTFRRSALQGLLDRGHASTLHKSSIDIVIASSKQHERVGRSEHIIKKIKFLLASALKTWIFHDSFDFAHKVALINHYLNELPLFNTEKGSCTPLTLEQSMLSRSKEKLKFFTFPNISSQRTRKSMHKLRRW